MTNINCDEVRELLPELDAERLPPERAAPLHAHVSSCDGCRMEAALIARLRASAPMPPPGLEARVLHSLDALRAATAEAAGRADAAGRPRLRVMAGAAATLAGAHRNSAPRRFRLRTAGARRWALAASVTIMVTAGAVVWRISNGDGGALTTLDAGTQADVPSTSPLPEWPAANGVVAGGAVLDDLSDDQLKTLLEEMQS